MEFVEVDRATMVAASESESAGIAALRWVVKWFGIPIIAGVTGWVVYVGMVKNWNPIVFFTGVLIGQLVLFQVLETLVPWVKPWKQNHQLRQDLGHNLLFALQGQIVPIISIFLGSGLGAWIYRQLGHQPWPTSWPVIPQIVLALVIAEFVNYGYHRFKHQTALGWRFHSVHHSAPRLVFSNSLRVHVIELMFIGVVNTVLFSILAPPDNVNFWLAIFYTANLPFGHANLDFASGPLKYVIVTPDLHRWHHSPNISEGNTNYGCNFMFCDLLFKTWFLPKDRPPPTVIGIGEPMPATLLGQLAHPFVPTKRWKHELPPVTAPGEARVGPTLPPPIAAESAAQGTP